MVYITNNPTLSCGPREKWHTGDVLMDVALPGRDLDVRCRMSRMCSFEVVKSMRESLECLGYE